MANDKKKQAKARRDQIAEKLKQISSTSIVVVTNKKDESQHQNVREAKEEEIQSKFAPLDPDDVVSRKVEEKFVAFVMPPTSSHKKNNIQDNANANAASSTRTTSNKSNNNNDNNNIGNDDYDYNDESDQQHREEDAAAPAFHYDGENVHASTTADAAADGRLLHHLLSNRQRKHGARPTIAALKALAVRRPDLVELHDTNAPEPQFLVQLKEMRNTIAVPHHWAQKSAFMSHTVDRDATSTFEQSVMPNWIVNLKLASAWEQKNYDPYADIMRAFIVGHPAPSLTSYGDLFYEGKDMRARYHGYRPGVLSQRLRAALDMGPSVTVPPPWLTGMQRIARLPPSYPNLKIPGVNAPIPSGARYGRGRNEWGEPPRDPRNNNKFLFEGVDRSSASVQDVEERSFVNASRWGGASSSASSSSSSSPLFSAAQVGSHGDGFGALPSIFTAPKEVIEAAKRRRQEQEEREQQQRDAQLAEQQAMQQQFLQFQQLRNSAGGINVPQVAVPQHYLAAAGIYQYQQQQQQYPQQGQGQFGIDVNIQRNQPGMGLLNSAGVYR